MVMVRGKLLLYHVGLRVRHMLRHRGQLPHLWIPVLSGEQLVWKLYVTLLLKLVLVMALLLVLVLLLLLVVVVLLLVVVVVLLLLRHNKALHAPLSRSTSRSSCSCRRATGRCASRRVGAHNVAVSKS
jgi:hypothetical protein